MAKKIICLILAVILLIFLLAACAENNAKENSDTQSETVKAQAEDEDPLAKRMAIPDNLPEINLNGIEWRVMSPADQIKNYFYAEKKSAKS